MDFVRDFGRISKSDATVAGGKGASLGEMTQAGIKVPPGFVVLSLALEWFLKEANLEAEIDAILHTVDHREIHTVEHASESIRNLILAVNMPQPLTDYLSPVFEALDPCSINAAMVDKVQH